MFCSDFFKMKLLICCVFVLLFVVSFVCADCGIVTKKQWGGLSPTKVEYLPRPIDLIIIQHTVTPTCQTDSACEERVANIQSYHMDNLNFRDIGHSFLIGDNGKVYEGAGWLHVGAHTLGYNRKSLGVAFIGNFNNDEPKPAALEAAKALFKCGVDMGHLKADYKVVAHRQLIGTESPGRKLYREIRNWPEWLEDVSSIKI